MHGMSNPPCTSLDFDSRKCNLAVIQKPSCKKELHILKISLGTCPTISPPSFFTAMAYVTDFSFTGEFFSQSSHPVFAIDIIPTNL